MAVWQWLVDSAGALLLIALAYGVLLVVRRRLLARDGGTFELSVRTSARVPARGWVLGIGRYDDDSLEWFRVFSLWPGPKRRWLRSGLSFVSQRDPTRAESLALYAGHVIVVCGIPEGTVEMAMSPSALTGLQAWLEAAPPTDPALRAR
ncbi:MAG: DUF2550 domain-containing protein [Marmoricola sp.]